ncbi:MAG: carboxypeptidase regulatory-like domain-containing protein [Pyrinomonadaceae bacterium]
MLLAVVSARAQTPTGIIAGVVNDAAGAPVPAARLRLTNLDSGLTRSLDTSAEGDYSAATLPPGVYRVTAEAAGFSLLQRTATVETGTTTTVNLTLQVGEVRERVTVDTAAPLVNYEHHQVGGLVSRQQIENLPLNGRNFLELAKLEPGVTNPARLNDNRVFVSFLGSGFQTVPRVGYSRVTVDGASITIPGNAGVIFQVSQDVVQEFQLSTVNFDLSTGLASNGAINIVTRSGGNDYHGDGFFFYRDQHLAAYPGLRRDAGNPQPFFQRQQSGFRMGGPIRRERAFFFASYERQDQRGVASIQPRTSEFAHLGGIFPSPSIGDQFSARADVRLNAKHNAFVRYTHDDNGAFANAFTPTNLPSGWVRRTNQAGQGLVALTSVLSSRVVNDFRFSYFFVNVSQRRATAEDCPGCLGLGAPRITIPDIGLTFGDGGTVSFGGRRYQLTDSLVWQKGNHRLRFGFDWEHVINTNSDEGVATQITLWSPGRVRQLNPAIPLPASFTTLDDILRLPLQSFTIPTSAPAWFRGATFVRIASSINIVSMPATRGASAHA